MSAESVEQYPGNIISPPPVPKQVTVSRYQCPKPGCDSLSETEHGVLIHAARAHTEGLTKYLVACHNCQDTFYVQQSRRDTARYCSRSCRGQATSTPDDPDILSSPPGPVDVEVTRYQCPIDDCDQVFKIERGAQRHVTDIHPTYSGVTVECERCEEVFHRKASAASYARFCSEKCRDRSRRRRVWLICDFCKEPFWTHECREDIARFCSTECHYFGVLAHPIAWCDPEDVGLSKIGETHQLRTLKAISMEMMSLE